MPKGSQWKKSVQHLTTNEIINYYNCFEYLKNWGMFSEYYMHGEKIFDLMYFLRTELINRKEWNFINSVPKESLILLLPTWHDKN